MIRDFTREKKEEIYSVLDRIDDREWKPFMAWCGGRAGEFGVWADRLGIQSYTRQIDNYQRQVLAVNDSTRSQIDDIFENVAETDRRYAEIFRGHGETVRMQIWRVRTMIQALQSADRTKNDIRAILYTTGGQTEVPYREQLENGKRVLENYMNMKGVTDPAQQRKICELILERQPGMLVNLYANDCRGGNTGVVYSAIMEYYDRHKMDITIEDAAGLMLGDVPLQQIQKETFVGCWNYLLSMELTVDQSIAVIANIYAEGELSPSNRQNTAGNQSIEDPDYTYRVNDNVGYGIFQWTYFARKQGLQDMANNMGKDVSDLEVQLAYFRYEMEESNDFKDTWPQFLSIQDRQTATIYFYCNIEKPNSSFNANSTAYNNAVSKRTGYAEDIAKWYETIFNN